MIKKTLTLFLFTCATVLAQPLPQSTFAKIFVPSAQGACPALPFSSTRAPDNRSISILSGGKFLEIQPGHPRKVKADCAFDVAFASKLLQPETVLIDVRIAEQKDPAARVVYAIALGKQVHHFDLGEGMILDGEPLLRRFLISNIPRETKKIRVRFRGEATNGAGHAAALIAIDSFDACFVAHPDHVGCNDASPAPPTK